MQEAKIKEEEFVRVCHSAKLIERKAKVPRYSIKDGSEGIELQNGTIVCFNVVDPGKPDAETIYKDAVCNNKDILAVIGAFEVKEEKKGKENEVVKTAEKSEEASGLALLPEFLTPGLMEKWKKLSTTERILMFQKTPQDQIFEVAIGKNPDTQKMEYASYVKGNYMFREANAAFLFDWELEIVEVSISETGVSVRGILKAWFSEYGKYLTRPATGYQERNKKIDAQQAQKGATTDAIKKGLSLFGFNSDIYSGDI